MKTLLVLLACAAGLTVTACNTVQGVGQDAQAAGRAIERTAQDVAN